MVLIIIIMMIITTRTIVIQLNLYPQYNPGDLYGTGIFIYIYRKKSQVNIPGAMGSYGILWCMSLLPKSRTSLAWRFLLTSKVMPMMTESSDARVCMIGSVTGHWALDPPFFTMGTFSNF